MEDALEDLEKKFILDKDLEQEDLQRLVTKVMKYCKINKQGFVVVLEQKISIAKKIMLVLSARYLANRLQVKLGRKNPVPSEVSAREISKMLNIKHPVTLARLKELKDLSLATPKEKGVYEANPYKIEEFLDDLGEKK